MNRVFILAAAVVLWSATARADDGFEIVPSQLQLDGPFARAQLLVRSLGSAEAQSDLTHRAIYQSSRPEVASVKATGQILALSDGDADIIVTVNGKSRSVPVRVTKSN